ncbi:MAG: TIM barrel protein [Phycisphaerae bacterium]|nr:TIM barrel protein [Phycisphaerae bacterium]
MIPTLVIREPIAERPDALCTRARACGASAVAPAMGPQDALSDSVSMDECRRVREALTGLENGISTVLASLTPQAHFGRSEPVARNTAMGRVMDALERTAWLGARVLVLDAVAIVSADCTYAAALNGTHSALQRLRLTAQRLGVELAIAAPQPRFLLSPVELRNLLDEQHDSGITAALDIPACHRIGHPADWIDCLGRRVGCILIHHKELQADARTAAPPAEVAAALSRAAFSGPLCSVDPKVIGEFPCG